jgi:hypothetical protein
MFRSPLMRCTYSAYEILDLWGLGFKTRFLTSIDNIAIILYAQVQPPIHGELPRYEFSYLSLSPIITKVCHPCILSLFPFLQYLQRFAVLMLYSLFLL